MEKTDVAVVGAGPVGCVCALAHAQQGANVTLIEANPTIGERFAGELLHPTAIAALEALGLAPIVPALDHPPIVGFAVYGPEAPGGVRLPYSDSQGRSFHFPAFLRWLRERCLAHPGIRWLPRYRVVEVEGQQLRLEEQRNRERRITVSAPRLVGADGRFSVMRRSLGDEAPQTRLSFMAGLLLDDVELPDEGHGHVLLGTHGPALVYRISARQVRVCLDVPAGWRKERDRGSRLWGAYASAVPGALRAPLRAALHTDRMVWAVNGVRPRRHYGRPGLALVGDAVGHFHPLTAAGMTMGFTDASVLAGSPSVNAYSAKRWRARGPALLATALYEIFSVNAAPTAACRRAVFSLWRERPGFVQQTMALLSGAAPGLAPLAWAGAQMSTRAAREMGGQGLLNGSTGELFGLFSWLLQQRRPTPFEPLRLAQDRRYSGEAA